MSQRLLPLLLAFLIAAGPARAMPPVWVARDADSAIVLFGSVHMLPPGLNWTPKALDEALKGADDLWFEIPVDAESTAASARIAVQRGVLPPDQRLSAMLSPEGRARLARLGARLELSPTGIDALQPWLAEITLTVAFVARRGADGSSGVEQSLAAAAPPAAQRRAFESVEEQIGLFADAPLDEQVASLEETLRQLEDEPQNFEALIQAWVSGDLAALERLGLEPLKAASPAVYERLIVERNRRWAQALAERLEGSGRTVVIVGAGHLIGPDGLPAMLRARGIAVEGP